MVKSLGVRKKTTNIIDIIEERRRAPEKVGIFMTVPIHPISMWWWGRSGWSALNKHGKNFYHEGKIIFISLYIYP